jgi:hypothetical protein
MDTNNKFKQIVGTHTQLKQLCKQWCKSNPGAFDKHRSEYGNANQPYEINHYSVPLGLLFENSEFLSELHNTHPFNRANIFYMEPYTTIFPHSDPDRNVSINMLITGQDSKFLFFDDTKFVELEYQPDTMYLCNSSNLHTILNFSKPRLLLTMKFHQTDGEKFDPETIKPTYSDIYNHLENNNLFA